MLKRSLLGGLVGGLILFIWSTISWMVIPWHCNNFHDFTDSSAVETVIRANVPQSGIYLLPSPKSMKSLHEQNIMPATIGGPQLFAVVHVEDSSTSMALPLVIQFISQVFTAFVITALLCKTSGLSYKGRLSMVMALAVVMILIAYVPNWIWFHYDTAYTLVLIADLLISWFLAGLVLAKISQ